MNQMMFVKLYIIYKRKLTGYFDFYAALGRQVQDLLNKQQRQIEDISVTKTGNKLQRAL